MAVNYFVIHNDLGKVTILIPLVYACVGNLFRLFVA